MIGFFPHPYPNELLYSVLARYHQRAMYKTRDAIARDLFCTDRATISIDLPAHLNRVIEAIPFSQDFSADNFINEHTLLPFYAPFLPRERVMELRKSMKEDNQSNTIHSRLGILTSKIRLESLRFCPKCVKEDRLRYGETYWQRSHQIPGGMVCFTHKVWLEQNDQRLFQLGSSMSFLAAEQVVPIAKPRLLDMQSHDHQTHWYIARSIEWLLKNNSEGHNLSELRGRYLGLLLDRTLVTTAGAVRMRLLQDIFLQFYSKEILKELSCEIDLRFNWLKRILQHPRVTQHPIQHMFLMNFLGVSIEEFFSLPITPQPFGAGPWPCLNPVCKYFNEPVIINCQLRTAHKKWSGIFGIFQCECGYSYRDRKPKLKNNKRGATNIISFGSVWEAMLRDLYKENYAVSEMALQLGVSTFMIRRKGRELGLIKPLSKNGGTSSHKIRKGRPKLLSSKDLLSKKTIYRKQWKKLVKENPTSSRTELRRIRPSVYNFLAKHDSEWLDNASPPRRNGSGPSPIVDWKERDYEYASAAQTYSENLRQILGRPVRVSKSRIAKAIGALAVVTKRAHLIPFTVEVLERVSETEEEYAIRRIEWATNSIQNKNLRVTSSRLITHAALSRSMQLRPAIQEKLREVLEQLYSCGEEV